LFSLLGRNPFRRLSQGFPNPGLFPSEGASQATTEKAFFPSFPEGVQYSFISLFQYVAPFFLPGLVVPWQEQDFTSPLRSLSDWLSFWQKFFLRPSEGFLGFFPHCFSSQDVFPHTSNVKRWCLGEPLKAIQLQLNFLFF